MPKVFLTQAQRDLAAAADADDAIRMLVAAWKLKTGGTQKALAEQIGMTDETLCRRMRRPENFTLQELRRLSTAIGLTREQTQKCVI